MTVGFLGLGLAILGSAVLVCGASLVGLLAAYDRAEHGPPCSVLLYFGAAAGVAGSSLWLAVYLLVIATSDWSTYLAGARATYRAPLRVCPA